MKRYVPLAALLLLAVSWPLRAQQHPNVAKGFNANGVYQFHQLDSVNQFNGNLTISIPIGASYPVASGFSYKLALHGNANFWDAEEDRTCLIAPAPVIAYAHRRANAGLGFILTLGRLYPPEDPTALTWTWESPDGADHVFRGSGNVRYTDDGSYLRMTPEGDRRKVEFPDGSVHTFKPPIASEGPWLLEKITNPFPSNYLEVRYYQPDPNNPGGEREATCVGGGADCGRITKWVLSDNWGRQHVIRFREVLWDSVPRMLVESVELSSFDDGASAASCNGVTQPAGIARYSFAYDDQVLLNRPEWHTSGPNVCVPNKVRVSLLRTITLPDCTSFALDYQGGFGDAGVPAKLTLPTGGAVRWTWQQYAKPVRSSDIIQYQFAWGVATRELIDRDGFTRGLWTYTSVPDCAIDPITGPVNACRELKATIVDPLGNKTEQFFAIEPDQPMVNEYGKPFTRKTADATGTRWLSQKTWSAGNTLLRSTYVAYDDDTTAYSVPITSVNARMKSSRTVYEDDMVGNAGLYLDTDDSDYDGLGHYRKTTVGGTLADTVQRVTTTNYNPNHGTHAQFVPLQTVNWITGMFDRVSTAEGGDVASSEYCFDSGTGFLLRTRALKSLDGTQNTHDLVSVFTADARGNVAREEHYGGDGASVLTGANWCAPLQPPAASPVYRVDHTLGNDGVITSQYVTGSSGQALGFFAVNDLLDLRTGLVKKSTDSAGVVTDFVYDRMGRLTLVKPTGAAWTKYTYAPAGTAAAMVSVARYPNGQTSGTALTSMSWEFDGIGRPVIERQIMPDGIESRRETSYNALGWTTITSELGRAATLPLTAYTYDSLGRVLSVHLPDDSQTTFSYLGIRRKTRTSKVSMAVGAADVAVNAVENYDAFGRLLSVKENSGPQGELVTTTYTYDIGSRLSSVTMAGSPGDVSQNRIFDYDGRGFLQWESHAESGMKSYTYDARGHVLTSELGSAKTPFDLKYTYDAAERLVKLEGRNPENLDAWRPVKEFTWATNNVLTPAPADYRNGKLLTATRYNYKPDPGFSSNGMNDVVRVTETYAYRDAAGHRTGRTTTIATSYDGLNYWQEAKSFTQSEAYDDLGQQSAVQYPMCLDCGTPPGYPPRNVAFSYSRGRPVAVSEPHPTIPGTLYNWVQSVSYWPNGMRNVLTHKNAMSDTQTVHSSGMARPGELKTETYSVCKAPTITAQSLGGVRSAGGAAAHLFVQVSGTGPMTYRWLLASNSTDAGSSASTFDATPSATTSYYVSISNACKSIRSKTMTVKVGSCVTPWIEEATATRNPNGSFRLSAGGVGADPLSYTWRRLPDQTVVGSTSEITTGILSTSTSYEVTVTNSCGSETRSVQAYLEPAVAAMNITVAQQQNVPGTLNVTWNAVPGATSYVLSRRTASSGMAVYKEQTATTYPDQNLPADVAYAYMVTAYNASNTVVGKSAVKAATTLALTGVSNGAVITAAPFDQLLRGVNAVRALAGWSSVMWSNILSSGDPLPQPGAVISSRHLLAIRLRLNEAFQALGVTITGYSDPDPHAKVIQSKHMTEIQSRLKCGKETCS